ERLADPAFAVLGAARPRRGDPAFAHWLAREGPPPLDPPARGETGMLRLTSANVSLPTGLLDAVGGFDHERFPDCLADLDLAYRLAEHGARLVYEPRARVALAGHATLARAAANVPAAAAAERAL